MNILQKLKETLSSVLPVMAIVIVLGLTAAPLSADLLLRFSVGGILLVLGLTVFLLGVDIVILPIGERAGAALTAKRNLPILLGASFVIGFMVTIAEPDVQVLANQIRGVAPAVNKWALVCMIAAGVGVFVVLGLLRTVLSLNLKLILIICYILLFVLAAFSPKEFQGIAFDAGGATTGPMTVPFIMALGVGVAAVRTSGTHDKSKGDNSFGLTGIASIGPVAAVCLYGLILPRFGGVGASAGVMANSAAGATDIAMQSAQTGELGQAAVSAVSSAKGLALFVKILPGVVKEVSLALLPLVLMFAVFQIFLLKMPPVQIRRMIKGLLYSFAGLVLFLVGVNGGFMPAGEELGKTLGAAALSGNIWWKILLVATAMVFGAVVVCAEPAVWVLTEQVESVSGGNIKRKVMLTALSSGVALSVGLSMLRVLCRFNLWYILIPGYGIALLISLFCPPLFTAIAFDSGGVASGPMTSTFILSFTLGAAMVSGGNPVTDAFGVIALVAMTPLIAIQILGIIYRIKSGKTTEVKK